VEVEWVVCVVEGSAVDVECFLDDFEACAGAVEVLDDVVVAPPGVGGGADALCATVLAVGWAAPPHAASPSAAASRIAVAGTLICCRASWER
jgi:hypothetical protein